MKTYTLLAALAATFMLFTGTVFGQLIESQRLKTVAATGDSTVNIAGTTDELEEREFGAIPALTALLGTRELIPNITLIGAKNFTGKSKKWYGAIRAFTGSVPNEEDEDDRGASALFVTEASTFGFTSAFTRAIGKNEKLGITFNLNYLGKNLKPDSIHTVSTSVFQGKLGFEIVPVKEVVSVYINVNGLAVADNIASFKEHYANERYFKFFIDYGAKIYLDTALESDLSIVIDLNFIAQNGDIKAITKNNDLVIPVLKIGLKKSLQKSTKTK